MDYMTKYGKPLFRKAAMFYWRGRYFSGLVTVRKMEPFQKDGWFKQVSAGDLYDDPEDSFAAHVGIKSSIEMGLIQVSNVELSRADK
jgi:hypothetical protein